MGRFAEVSYCLQYRAIFTAAHFVWFEVERLLRSCSLERVIGMYTLVFLLLEKPRLVLRLFPLGRPAPTHVSCSRARYSRPFGRAQPPPGVSLLSPVPTLCTRAKTRRNCCLRLRVFRTNLCSDRYVMRRLSRYHHTPPHNTRRTQESHTDLRDWYVHCLDFRVLKRRLVDDPPDPHDDHPSMMEAHSPPFSSASAGGGGTAAAAAAAAAAGDAPPPSTSLGGGGGGDLLSGGNDADLEQRQGLLAGGRPGGGAATEAAGGDGGGAWGRRTGGGLARGISLAFPDPASRVFVFEINEVRKRL